LVVFLGDVSGKGIPASLFMVRTISLVQLLARPVDALVVIAASVLALEVAEFELADRIHGTFPESAPTEFTPGPRPPPQVEESTYAKRCTVCADSSRRERGY
jgi:hypothetical protein